MRVTGSGAAEKATSMIDRVFDVEPTALTTRVLHRDKLRLIESLTSIGNGHMGMRGNFEEGYSGDHHLGTYLAGVWYPDRTRVGWWKNGYPEYFGKAINALNFAAVDVLIDEAPVDLATMEPTDFRIRLDLRNGLLTRSFELAAAGSTFRISFEKFLSVVEVETCWQRVVVECLTGGANVELRPRIERDVHNQDSNYGEQFWEETGRRVGEQPALSTRTVPNSFGVPQFTVTAVSRVAADVKVEPLELPTSVGVSVASGLEAGQRLEIVRTTAVLTSRDHEADTHEAVADALLERLSAESFDEHLARHTAAWEARWATAAVTVVGDDEAQQGIAFNLFQLFSTYYGHDYRLNIGPKGFTGEKYGGATYWDTEAYLVPLYLAVADPEVTKALLRYRHEQLPQAQHNARQQGLAGALYPMVTFNGIECHNEWEITFEEIHRNGAIAFAIHNYANYTGDRSYLEGDGADVLVEISRFWADRVHFSKRRGQWMLHGVTGPNEYENNINNNFYTNYLAAWTLRSTAELVAAGHGPEVAPEEVARWREIADGMYFPTDDELGIFVQHDTFLDKDLTPVAELRPEDRPLNQNWSWDRILRSCYIKQADVLQGMYLFEDDFTADQLRRNFAFYEPLTVHESSLSASVHSVLASSIGEREKAVELYQRTARLDLDNYNADTEDGLHITSMSGAWLAIVQGFAGMRVRDGQLSFAPYCPDGWESYSFSLEFRGRTVGLTMRPGEAAVQLRAGDPLTVAVAGEPYELSDRIVVPLS